MTQEPLPDDVHAHILLKEVEELPRKVDLFEYREVMKAMRHKGYSYREVADWLSEKVGVKISRNKISYVVNTDPAKQLADTQDEDVQDELDERENQ